MSIGGSTLSSFFGRRRGCDDEAQAMIGILIKRAGVPEQYIFNMQDLKNTLVEQAGDAVEGLCGPNEFRTLTIVRNALQRTGKSALDISVLLSCAEESESVSTYLVSVIKSYFLVKEIVEEVVVGVEEALALGAVPNYRCRYLGVLHTPIVAAARTGNTEICKLLIDAGASVDVPQANSETALANAAMLGDYFMVDFLLENGAKPNKVTHAGTALAVANNLAIVELLDAYGADPNIPDSDGDLPIVGFIDQGRYEVVAVLISMGTDLKHQNNYGENSIDRAKRRGDEAMIDLVVNGYYREPEFHTFISDEFASVLAHRISRLVNLSYDLSSYEDYATDDVHQRTTSEARARSFKLVRKAIEAKRSGDLVAAHRLYVSVFEETDTPRTDYVWGWFKVLLLAKNYRDAYLVLGYYHALSASYNHLRRNRGEISFENSMISECFLTLEFEPIAVFFQSTRAFPVDKQAVEEKIRTFGGSPLWASYTMSGREFDYFLRFFCLNNQGYWNRNENNEGDVDDRAVLEARVRSGDSGACVALARLIFQEDRERAIALCERAMSAGEEVKAPFFLAWLLSDSDPDRAKRLYEALVSAGDNYASANNLAVLIKDEDPDRAKELFKRALDAGNTKNASFSLAEMIEDDDPEQAERLYELAIGSGNDDAYVSLALLLSDREPERAIRLCEQAIEAGHVYDGAFYLGSLLRTRDRKRAVEAFEKAIEAGDEFSSTFQLAVLLMEENPNQAKELFKRSIAAGNHYAAPLVLANMVKTDEPEAAARYYRIAADAGNNDARVALARMIYKEDKQQAIELCESAVDAGDRNDGAFFLAFLLEDTDIEKSKMLYQLCVDAGFCWGAGRNLGNLIKDEDPDRAAELYEKSLLAGNTAMRLPLARLVSRSDKRRAIQLCEEAISDSDDGEARFFLARLLESEDPERSKELYRVCVDNGDSFGAANNLANLIKKDDPASAKKLYEASLESGNVYYAARNLANMLLEEDPERAAELFRMGVDAGNCWCCSQLARLIADKDRAQAIELCEQGIAGGDVIDAPFFLAWLLEKDNPERSKELYQSCVDNGNVFNAANNLANLIKVDDPAKAKVLFKMSLKAGNVYYAAGNLATMLLEEDPERAAELFSMGVNAGNIRCCSQLARLVYEKDRTRAIELCEQGIAGGDNSDAPFFLAWLLEKDNPERSKELYQSCVENGNHFSAANNLANLIKNDDPKRAIELYEMSIEAGNAFHAAFNLAAMVGREDPGRAIRLYREAANAGRPDAFNHAGILAMKSSSILAADLFGQAINAGDKVYAPCNLGHMLIDADPERAEELYRMSLENESNEEATESLIGLWILLEERDPDESRSCLSKALGRNNLQFSVSFMADYYDAVNVEYAERIRGIIGIQPCV